MTDVLIATTVAPWKCNGRGELAWLQDAEARWAQSKDHGVHTSLFCAFEVDGRGMDPYRKLEARLQETKIPVKAITFSIDNGDDEFNERNRLTRICTGRNLAHDYAQQMHYTHILFVDSDTAIPTDSVWKLASVDHGIVCGYVPSYCHDGPRVIEYPNIDLREHWTTAGFMLVRRDVFRHLRWRWDLEIESTDDPCFQADAKNFGWGESWVRHDVIGDHVEPLISVEERPEDRTYYR